MNQEQEKDIVIDALARTYMCLYYIDLNTNTYTSYQNNHPSVKKVIPPVGSLIVGFENFATKLCKPEFTDAIRKFTNLSTLNARLNKKKLLTMQFLGIDDIWCEVSLHTCDKNPDGTLSHIVMGIRDIDEQKRAELQNLEELKQKIDADRNKTMFIQNMTHEIRTPLNAIFGFAQLLSMPDGTLTDDEKAEYLNLISNSYNMLSMHIDDVLDVADSNHGNYHVNIEDVLVNDVCRNALNMAKTRVHDGVNIYFTSDVDDEYVIQSDARRIQQLLVNYLTNACKHTWEGEIHLHCSTTENPGHLTFSVTDTGEGIPPEKAEVIFERFKKLNLNAQGSGLGLNICSLIAEKLNGKVLLDTSYTTGARFLFII